MDEKRHPRIWISQVRGFFCLKTVNVWKCSRTVLLFMLGPRPEAIRPFSMKEHTAEWFLKVSNVFNTVFPSHHGYRDGGLPFVMGVQARF